MAILIKNAALYAPEPSGVQDVFIINDKIVQIAKNIELEHLLRCVPEVEVVDAGEKILVPGFIDQHVHLIGGGGEMGFSTRTPEVMLSKVIEAGVTTVVGLLGTDGDARNVEALLAKAKGLEEEGLSTFIYTGSYKTPSVTLTGTVMRDIMFIDKVLGVKMALSDHRSSHFSLEELIRLASDARVAGMLANKPGVLHIHMGAGKSGLNMVLKALTETDLPITQFRPTHVTRTRDLFEQAKIFAKQGGYIDITSFAEMEPRGNIKPSKALLECITESVPLENITVSSDGNGSMPRYDKAGNIIGMGVGDLHCTQQVFKNLVQQEGIDISTALGFFTVNVAKALQLYPFKGCIRVGSDADLLIMNQAFKLDMVFMRGRKMMEQGKTLVTGIFEN